MTYILPLVFHDVRQSPMETIIPLPTELLLPVQCREGCSIHQTATGTNPLQVPASPRAGNGRRARQVTKGPISAGRQWGEPRFFSGQPGRGAGRGIFLSCDAAPGVLRNQGEQSGTRERSSQEGPRIIGRLSTETSVFRMAGQRKTSEPSGSAVK
jgi:hypothetical protein